MIKMSIQDIVDRYTIIKLKLERSNTTYNTIQEEFKMLENEINNYKYKNKIITYINQLYNINWQIWNLESDIRRWKENELWLE